MIRILSGAALIALLVVTVWWLHPLTTVALAVGVAFAGAWELSGLGVAGGLAKTPWLAFLSAGLALAFAWSSSDALVLILAPAIVLMAVIALSRGVADRPTLKAVAAAAPFYVGAPLGLIARIRLTQGPEAVSLLAVLVIASDSAQYFTGRALGRNKLAPSISPAKTIEGALGGLVASAAVGATLGVRWIPALTPMKGAALGLIVAVVGIIGDLFESALKRGAGVKDSSNLIPGHGGVLDRIDSWLLAGPVFFLFLRYVL